DLLTAQHRQLVEVGHGLDEVIDLERPALVAVRAGVGLRAGDGAAGGEDLDVGLVLWVGRLLVRIRAADDEETEEAEEHRAHKPTSLSARLFAVAIAIRLAGRLGSLP